VCNENDFDSLGYGCFGSRFLSCQQCSFSALDPLQPRQQVVVYSIDDALPLVLQALLAQFMFLGDYAHAEGDEHRAREEDGDEEKQYVTPMCL